METSGNSSKGLVPQSAPLSHGHLFPTVKPASGALQGEEMHLILSKDLPVSKINLNSLNCIRIYVFVFDMLCS